MTTIQTVCDYLERYAPTDLAEDWDNVGLILGDPELPCAKVMTCLTITPESASEAIGNGVDLIVSHHPLPFRPVQRITTALTPTKLIWDLARAGVSVYSPHTAFDSATQGINQMLCDRLQLTQTESLIPNKQDPTSLSCRACSSWESPVSRFNALQRHAAAVVRSWKKRT